MAEGTYYTHQSPPILDEAWTGSSMSDLFTYICDPPVNSATRPTPFSQSNTSIYDIEERSGTSHHENPVCPSTLPGTKGVTLVSLTSSEDPARINPAGVDTTHTSLQDGVLPRFLTSTTFAGIPFTSTVARYEEVSPNRHTQSYTMSMSKRPYSCEICHKRYAQTQSVLRHHREKHNPSSCLYCDFKWSRPYQYRDHLEKKHPSVDPNIVLGMVAKSRGRVVILAEYVAQQQISPPAIEHDQRSCPEPQQRPLTLPLPVVSKDPNGFLPDVSSVAYDPQHDYGEATITMHKPEDSRRSRSENISFQDGQNCLTSAHPSGSTAAHDLSNPEMPFIPAITLPVGCFGSPTFVDPTVQPSGSMYSYPLSVMNYDEIRRNTFNTFNTPPGTDIAQTLTPVGSGKSPISGDIEPYHIRQRSGTGMP